MPIPKTSLGGSETKVNYQHARNATFLEKIGHRIVNGFQKVQDTVLGVFDPILESGGNFLGLEDDNNEIGKKFSKVLINPIFATLNHHSLMQKLSRSYFVYF